MPLNLKNFKVPLSKCMVIFKLIIQQILHNCKPENIAKRVQHFAAVSKQNLRKK